MFRKALFLIGLLSLGLATYQSGSAKTPIFSDGFESGNLSAWSTRLTDGSDLAVTAPAALSGAQGMRALIDGNGVIFVQDNRPNNEDNYDLKFLFDPNSIAMANLDNHVLFKAFDLRGTANVEAIRIELRRSSGLYQVRAASRNDNLTYSTTAWFTISDARHQIEVEWDAATPGETDGNLKLKLDGVLRGTKAGLDNETFRVDMVRLGAMGSIDNGTRGTYYFDQFESFR